MDYLGPLIIGCIAIAVVFGLLRYGVQYLLKFILAHYIIASIVFAVSYGCTLLVSSFGQEPIGSFLWVDLAFWLSLVQSFQLFFVLILYVGLLLLVMHASTLSLYVPSVRLRKYLLYVFLLPLALSSVLIVAGIVLYYFGVLQATPILSSFVSRGIVQPLLHHLPLWIGLHGFLTLFIVLEVQWDRQKYFRKEQSIEEVENDLLDDDRLG